MGSLPQLSILKGPQRQFTPKLLHKIFEEQVDNGTCANKTALIFHGILFLVNFYELLLTLYLIQN